ncbi:hypothetical protein SLE2022_088500 [Rubroshorea leprosula]
MAVITTGGKDYHGNLTFKVFITCIIAASGGVIFGYDLRISGGVTSMDSLLKEFFPAVYKKNHRYCKFDSQTLCLHRRCIWRLFFHL